MNFAAKIDYALFCEPVARELWGEPTKETDKELRWGTNGSRSLDRRAGKWFDHELGEGGSTIELLKRELRYESFGECTRWLYNKGLTGRTNGPASTKLEREKIVAHYDYRDETGDPLFQVVRLEPKTFRQRRPDGKGGWIWQLGEVRRVLYRLPELIGAIAEERPVFITEGEKDCDNLQRLGIPATTNPGGAGKWKPEYSKALRGANVILLADNDEAGRKHVDEVGAALTGIAARVRRLDLPNLPLKGDVSDWIIAGGNAHQLWRLVEAAPDWRKSSDSTLLANFVFVGDESPAPQKMLIDGVMPAEGLPFVGGQSSAGKTFISILMATCVASLKPFFGRTVNERVGTVIVAAEGKGMLRSRIDAAMHELGINEDLPIAWVKQVPDFNSPRGLQVFIDQLQAISEHFKIKFGVRLGLVFVDTVSASFDIKEEADNAEAARVCKTMRRIGEATGALVVPIHHYGKNAGVGLRGASAWRANADFVLSVMADIDPQTGDVSNRQLAIAKDRDGSQGPLTPFSLKSVNLGIDDQGRPWGSMVAVAEVSIAAKPATDWPSHLSVFRRALVEALLNSGVNDQPFSDGPLLRVVDVEAVRAEFYKVCVVDSDTEAGRQDARRKQFSRKLEQAQQLNLVGARVGNGRTLLWLINGQDAQ
jgi:hypothetical protein